MGRAATRMRGDRRKLGSDSYSPVCVSLRLPGIVSIVLGEPGLGGISDNTAANLGVVSILCSLIAIPIGVIGWRWAERRRQNSVLGQAAALFGVGTFGAWFALLVYALGKDTP
jgi:hypothetical protein